MNLRTITCALFALLLASCGGGSSDPAQNDTPAANAGADRSIPSHTLSSLDGSASNAAQSYNWTLLSSPTDSNANLVDADTSTPDITPDKLGDYVFELVINAGSAQSSSDQVTVSVFNSAPVAVGSVIQTGTGTAVGAINKIIDVDGSTSSDIDQDTLSYQWSLIDKPAGSNAMMQDPTEPASWFTPDVAGDYSIKLVVSDGSLSDSVTFSVSAANTPPEVSIRVGLGQTASGIGETINLLGQASDLNGDSLTYSWSFVDKPASSVADFFFADQALPAQASLTLDVEGEYVIQLIVNDGYSDSAPATVTVTAAAVNVPPLAHAGSDRAAPTGKVFTLDGSLSADPDGSFMTYSWRIASQPSGSSASLSNSDTATASFTPDVAGDYEMELTVKDFAQYSQPDNVIISAFAEGSQPVAVAGNDRVVSLGDSLSLDGGASYDPGSSGSLSYSWSITSAPSGSNASFDNASSMTPLMNADSVGNYVVSLIVNDGSEDSIADTLNVTVQQNIGVIDESFGSNGMAGSGNDITQPQYFVAQDMQRDAAGNFYLTGSETPTSGGGNMALWKFDSSGNPDTSFNTSGMTTYATASLSNGNRLVIDDSGNVLVAGGIQPDPTINTRQLALWKFDANGVADSSFGNNGVVALNASSNTDATDYAYAIAITGSGKIVVAGTSNDGTNKRDATKNQMALWRFNSDGTLDASFNGNGIVLQPSSTAKDMVLESNGKIYIAGTDIVNDGTYNNYYLALWAFNPDGSLDSSFNATGKQTLNISTETGLIRNTPYRMALDSQGNIVIGGSVTGLKDDAVLWKFKPDGALDTGFNGQGYLVYNFRGGIAGTLNQSDKITAIAIDDEDNIYAHGNSGGTFYYGLWKFDANGKMDASFNQRGFASERLVNGFKTFFSSAIALDNDNKIYLSGSAFADNGTSTQHRDVYVIKYK